MTTRKRKSTPAKPKPAPAVEPELDDEVDDVEPELDDEVDDTEEPELEDDEVDDTPEENGSGLKDRETYTAKQVASRIGTDAKTLRKFFRSDASTVEPCGQGGRYEFDAGDLPQIKSEFDKWNAGKSTRTPREKGAPSEKKPRTTRQAPSNVTVIEEDDEILDLEDDEELDDLEPSDDELDEIDDEVDE